MIRITRSLGSLVVAGLVASAGAGCAGGAAAPGDESVDQVSGAITESVCPPGVPPTLTPSAGQTLKETLTGVGVQIYMCTATTTSFAWTFVAPQANLFNDHGRLVGTHFIGPTWQGNDGSTVVGQKVAAAAVEPSAIPWLLLNGSLHSAEDGRFSNVTSIQRLSTVGGIAPIDGCDATHIGALAQVPYTAQYVFYKATTRGSGKVCGG